MATAGELAEGAQPIARSEAFRRLAEEHLASAYRLARAILGDEAEAEDATQDAFVTAWRKWTTLRDPALFQPWFDRILVNTCRNKLRRGSRSVVRDVSGELGADPVDQIAGADDRFLLTVALARLTPDQRIVLALRYYRDLTVEQISERLGVPAGTVKSRLHYALRGLQALLSEPDAREAPR